MEEEPQSCLALLFSNTLQSNSARRWRRAPSTRWVREPEDLLEARERAGRWERHVPDLIEVPCRNCGSPVLTREHEEHGPNCSCVCYRCRALSDGAAARRGRWDRLRRLLGDKER